MEHKKVMDVYKKTDGVCHYCRETLPPDTDFLDEGGKVVSSRRNWHIEHMLPKVRGGSDKLENLVPACRRCNMQKGIRTSDEFINGLPPMMGDDDLDAIIAMLNDGNNYE